MLHDTRMHYTYIFLILRNKMEMKKAGERVDVVYKYNEGFTNAVRRTVYMRDLF